MNRYLTLLTVTACVIPALSSVSTKTAYGADVVLDACDTKLYTCDARSCVGV